MMVFGPMCPPMALLTRARSNTASSREVIPENLHKDRAYYNEEDKRSDGTLPRVQVAAIVIQLISKASLKMNRRGLTSRQRLRSFELGGRKPRPPCGLHQRPERPICPR